MCSHDKRYEFRNKLFSMKLEQLAACDVWGKKVKKKGRGAYSLWWSKILVPLGDEMFSIWSWRCFLKVILWSVISFLFQGLYCGLWGSNRVAGSLPKKVKSSTVPSFYECISTLQVIWKIMYYAHSLENKPLDKWQLLDNHLAGVAQKAARGSPMFLELDDGVLSPVNNHDLGKGTKAWQAYLRKANEIIDEFAHYYTGHPNHSSAGAKWLYDNSKEAGKLLAYCVSGHHGGLPNWDGSSNASLAERLQEPMPEVSFPCAVPNFPQGFALLRLIRLVWGIQLQFFVRMLFSCLVDADYLDTEGFIDSAKAGWRSSVPPDRWVTPTVLAKF